MPQIQIPDQLAERLNALMRPAGGVHFLAVTRSILGVIADEPTDEARGRALGYVFENWDLAFLSGPKTQAQKYQPPFDLKGRDRAAADALRKQGDKIPLRIISILAQWSADRADIAEIGRRAWAFLRTLSLPLEQAAALDTFRKGVAMAPQRVGGEPQYNEPLPDDRYHSILWRNRAALTAAMRATTDDRLHTKGAIGAAFLAALSGIEDPEERANVVGSALAYLRDCRSSRVVTELLAAAIPIGDLPEALAAAFAGKPCPSRGRVHGEGEHKDE